jgi:hypothetical protein
MEPIIPDRVYPVRALLAWGIGNRTLASLKRRGLRVLTLGKLHFVVGSDLISLMQAAKPAQAGEE